MRNLKTRTVIQNVKKYIWGISEICAEGVLIYLLDEEREYLKGEMEKLVIF